jgi:hypothetical protein
MSSCTGEKIIAVSTPDLVGRIATRRTAGGCRGRCARLSGRQASRQHRRNSVVRRRISLPVLEVRIHSENDRRLGHATGEKPSAREKSLVHEASALEMGVFDLCMSDQYMIVLVK